MQRHTFNDRIRGGAPTGAPTTFPKKGPKQQDTSLPFGNYWRCKEYGITLEEFEAGGWGKIDGLKAKMPRGLLLDFRQKNNDGSYVYMISKAFLEVAESTISTLRAEFIILTQKSFGSWDEKMKRYLKEAVYKAVMYQMTNKTLIERIVNDTYTTPNYESIRANATNWQLIGDRLGSDAKNSLMESRLHTYKWVENDIKYHEYSNGNVRIIEERQVEDIL